jgi:hypothetical protein
VGGTWSPAEEEGGAADEDVSTLDDDATSELEDTGALEGGTADDDASTPDDDATVELDGTGTLEGGTADEEVWTLEDDATAELDDTGALDGGTADEEVWTLEDDATAELDGTGALAEEETSSPDEEECLPLDGRVLVEVPAEDDDAPWEEPPREEDPTGGVEAAAQIPSWHSSQPVQSRLELHVRTHTPSRRTSSSAQGRQPPAGVTRVTVARTRKTRTAGLPAAGDAEPLVETLLERPPAGQPLVQ